jgi:hypothetical protein
MSPQMWSRVTTLLDACLDLEPAERTEYLDGATHNFAAKWNRY